MSLVTPAGVAVLRAGVDAYRHDATTEDHELLSVVLDELDADELRYVAETLLLALSVALDDACLLDVDARTSFDERVERLGVWAAVRAWLAPSADQS